jgi:hypothetical protein
MTIREILSVAESHGIKLRLDGDDVLFRAPPGALTPELRRLLRQRKAELIEFLRADAGAAPPRIPRGPDPSSGPGPLSAGQRRLWFLDHLAPGSAVYNVHFGLRVQGPLDVAALRASLTAIVSHHPMLRASFPEQDGRPSVVVAPSREWVLPFVDLRDVAGKESELARISRDHAAAPYDLARGPLLRTLLVALEHEEHVLLVGQHHIVTDATSLGLFVRDLLTCHRALASGRPIELVEPPVRYLDYARWQDEWLRSEPAKSMEAWWKRRLTGVPRLELPVSRTPSPVRTQEGAAHSFSIPADLTSAVKDLGRSQGCTLFVTLLSAWAAVLHRYSQQSDFAVGTVTAGRDRAELAELIGFFVNTLPLRCDFSGDPDAATVMQRLRKEVQEALEHQELPFDRIVNAAGADRGNDLNPLFRASFSLQGVPIRTAAVPGLQWKITLDTPDGAVADVAKFEVGLTMVETPDGLWATLQYARDLFGRSTIERMAEHYRTLLEGMVANPRSPICRLPLLTECERDALLAPAAVSRGGCIHEWFEEQAERRPGSIAVVCRPSN